MQPRLILASGPAEGRTHPLDGDRFTLGRQPDNDLQIPSREVSRHHCELVRGEDGHWRVRDLGSRHGVFVNGRPVRERKLVHSDQLTVGTTAFLFLLDDPTPTWPADEDPVSELRSSTRMAGGSTLLRNPTDILYLDSDRVEAALPAGGRMARDLHSLLRASNSLQGPLGIDQVCRRLGEAVAGALPADTISVALIEDGDEQPAVRVSIPSTDAPLPLPRVVVDQVLDPCTGLLVERVEDDIALMADAAIREARIRALVASPLLDQDQRPFGLVLASQGRRAESFDERHLDLLVALAGIASLALANARHLRWLERENQRLRDDHLAHDLIGESEAIAKVLRLVAKVAKAPTTVLIRGESGTGKELVAQAIHRSSPRAGGPFLAINCATLSETLLESELFGHEKGAFTGAVSRQIGKLEAAAGGTLFLDEVGEIPLQLQAKLLRLLQERRFERVGGTRSIEADVRVLAATHRDLEGMIRDGTFRQDLYYRLKVISIDLPPLRERREDIPLLAAHLAARHGEKLGRRTVGMDPRTRQCLMAYDWPGNVRELGNAIERALVLGEDDWLRAEDLPDEVAAAGPSRGSVVEGSEGSEEGPLQDGDFQSSVAAFKRRLVLDAWARAEEDYGRAAELLGIHVNSLHRMVRNLGLKERLKKPH